jgi:dimethylhistidine N-methyltransferase
MTTFVFPTIALQTEERAADKRVTGKRDGRLDAKLDIDQRVAEAVRRGLSSRPRRLPPWLFYDQAGSRLFDEITGRPEYYLTRTERGILAAHAQAMIARAAGPARNQRGANHPPRLRITELGAGSADKTRLLLKAVVERQGHVLYEPVDVSASALDAARERIEREIAGVVVAPRVMDYTHGSRRGLKFEPTHAGERRLVLYIGSSIGNFDPWQAAELLHCVRSGLRSGDGFLLGVDLVKDESTLLAAYDDAAGVTADFNLNLLARLNRELGADFYLESFEHRAVWNAQESRIEMHLESRISQRVWLDALDLAVEFAAGETIHTENSYKYRPGQPEAMLAAAGFTPVESWTDAQGWFAVCLARVA